MQIRSARPEDLDACVEVLAQLPEHFSPTTHHEVHDSFGSGILLVADSGGTIEGFLLARERYRGSVEITHAAVRADRQHNGVGTKLVQTAIDLLHPHGVKLIEVKTLDETSGYEPYVATRQFWEARGFIQVDCIDPLPGWDPGNPCAIYVKALTQT